MSLSENVAFLSRGACRVSPSGVGVITQIEEMDFRGVDTLYFVIYLDISDMTVRIPVDKYQDMGIRPIVGKEESQAASIPSPASMSRCRSIGKHAIR